MKNISIRNGNIHPIFQMNQFIVSSSRFNPPRSHEVSETRGFSLIELLVSMTLFSFLLSLLFFVFLHTLKVVEAGERRDSLERSAQILLDHLANEVSQSNLLRAKSSEIRIGVFERVKSESVEIPGKGKFLKPIYEERPVTYEKKGEQLLRNGKAILSGGMKAKSLRFDFWGYDPLRSYKGRLDFSELDQNHDGVLSRGEERGVTTIQVFLEISKGPDQVWLRKTKRLNPVLGDAIVRREMRALHSNMNP